MERVEKLRILEEYVSSGKPLVGIFAKKPQPGRVKTRLVPPLSGEEAADLYAASLRETVQRMTSPDLPFRTVLFHADDVEWFREQYPDMLRFPQQGGDLGTRMEAALKQLLEAGAPAAALVGSDSPDLPLRMILAALHALESAEAVTIPATDGGYVLIGKRRCAPELFQNIDWSTDKVLSQTRLRARTSGMDYREVGEWEDVDDLDSLRRLIARSPDSLTARRGRALLEGSDAVRRCG